MQNYPLSIFHASVRPESLPGADLLNFQKSYFCYFGAYLGPLGPKRASIIGIVPYAPLVSFLYGDFDSRILSDAKDWWNYNDALIHLL